MKNKVMELKTEVKPIKRQMTVEDMERLHEIALKCLEMTEKCKLRWEEENKKNAN